MRLIALLILAIAPVLSTAAAAQEPPGRAGRVAFTEGTVALYQDPEMGWEKAYVNSPITSENSLWTDPGSRAEVRVSGIAVRLDEATQLDVSRLDDDQIDAFVVRGSVAVRVRHFENNNTLDFATPHAQFRLFGAGRYRIDVDPERDETLLTVFTGSAGLRSAAGDIQVRAGNAIRIEGGPSPTFVRERATSGRFDRWALARDERWIERTSTQYVSTWMTGYEDLDQYGTWAQEPEYGAIWFPSRVDRGWVPYRDGHWAWVRPWGWTWIGAEPWGYAPYHYGRWTYVRDRWGWVPGRREARPVWAPALVAWVGGGNFSVRVNSGNVSAVGWYPLSPWERYDPWYRTNPTYVNRINVMVREAPARRDFDRNGRDDWRYRNRERGATVVQRDQFIDRRPVRQAAINVAADVVRQAPVASPTQLFTREDVVRRSAESRPQLRTPGSPPAAGAPVTSGAPSARQPAPASQPLARRQEAGTNFRPNFERRNAAPAPQASQPAAAQPAPAAPQAGTNPLARPRGDEAARQQQQQQQLQQQQRDAQQLQQQRQQQQERAGREAQQQQQQQLQQRQQQERAREAEQQQERAARDARQQQQRTLQEQQQRAAQEQQRKQQEQQRQQQERATRDAQQQQQRAAQEQQRQQQEQQRAAQEQQRQQQERATRDAQQQQQRAAQEQQRQQQERAARDAQQQQQRAAQEQQRQQQEQQRAAQEQQRQQQQAQQRQAEEQARQQARAAREAQLKAAQEAQQRAQAAQRPAPPPQAAPQAQPPAQPQAQPPAPPPQSQRPERGKDKDKDDKDKGKDDDERGRGRNR